MANEEQILDLATHQSFVSRAGTTDPILNYGAPLTPADFAAQFPQPLPTMELVAMCEEVTLLKYLPEATTGLKYDTWRELNELAFTSGSGAISFSDGECPNEFRHDGDDSIVTKKNIGTMKTLSISDILHSMASIASGQGIRWLSGPMPAQQDLTSANGGDMTTFGYEQIASLKEKELLLGTTLVLNGWDELLVNGDVDNNVLEFDGIVQTFAPGSGQHENDNTASGTFAAASFDRFLSESCAKPQVIFGHPTAIQELLSSYFQLGFAGSHIINLNGQTGIVPGYNFAGFVNTGIGRLELVGDTNFPRTNIGGGAFQSTLYGLRMTWNGVPLVYKCTQIPFSSQDLTPGCTAVRFQIWAKTALTIKHRCAHSSYISQFTGRIVTTCPVIL